MGKRAFLYYIIFSINCFSFLFAQNENSSTLEKFEHHYSRSKELNKISLFSESIKELNIAISIAKDNGWEKKHLDASVTLGEMMRRTGDHNAGVEILEKLTNAVKYPKIHVRKLGRMAALYAEGGEGFRENQEIKLVQFLNEGLEIANQNNFESEEASLSNELGYYIMHHGKLKDAKQYFERSSELFYKLKDTNNYVNVMCHIMHFEASNENYNKVDSIANNLLKLVSNHEWYGTEQTLYRNLHNRYVAVGDSINALRWMVKEKGAALKLLKVRSNNEMSFYRVAYETDKYQESAKESQLMLSEERVFSKNLLFFLSIVLCLIVGVIFLLVRQKKLANNLNASNLDLETSNKNYQLLIVESNHRIKNNLQMIISMLEYASYDVKNSGPEAFMKISSKIRVISALHKFLYTDVHNEFISVSDYFNEIIHLYNSMSPDGFEFSVNIGNVKIRSERIVYFGLILNELLANSYEHNKNAVKHISISVMAHNDLYEFYYCDQSSMEGVIKEGTGSQLIEQLIKRVKGSDFKLNRAIGEYKFCFNASI